MSRREEAEAAVKDPNPTIDGRRANVNLAYLGAKNRAATLPCMFNHFPLIIKKHISLIVSIDSSS